MSIETVPNDLHFHDQWSLHNLGQIVNGQSGPANVDIDWLEAMDLFTPASPTIVAVLDSGVALLHPDLAASIVVNPAELAGDPQNGIDDDGNGFIDDWVGWDFVDDDNLPLDEQGHGSLVASLIGASANDEVGISGVLPQAYLLPLRVFNDLGSGTVDAFLEASLYAVDRGARIINFSGGHFGANATESALIDWLDQQGVLLVAAAGNGGADVVGDDNDVLPVFPASHPAENVISVAATDRDDRLTLFSNFGLQSVDLAAPGKDILGADITRTRVFLEDFESHASGWTIGNNCHDSCFDWSLFTDAFGNTWANDSADLFGFPVDYLRNTNAWTASPPITLPLFGPLLSFRTWHALSITDFALAEIETGGSWRTLTRLDGFSDTAPPGTAANPGGTINADLSAFAGETVRLRFRLHSDHSFQADGFYVDDVAVSEVDTFEFDGRQFQFSDGTSFSAPLVSGVAALVWSQRPDLTHREVRQILLDSVDPVPGLAGRVATGGRLNARHALELAIQFVPEPGLAPALAAGVGGLAAIARRGRRRASM
jgi:subtilisin family serine protease